MSDPRIEAATAYLHARTQGYFDMKERHTALREAIASLEQQTRQRGLAACPKVQPPASGWSAIDMHSRTIGAVLLELADRIAALLRQISEP